MTSKKIVFLAVVLALVLSAPALWAQSASTSALTGTVTDPTGAVLPGVTVTATAVATNQSRTVVTTESGVYRIPLLDPGSYRVRFRSTPDRDFDIRHHRDRKRDRQPAARFKELHCGLGNVRGCRRRCNERNCLWQRHGKHERQRRESGKEQLPNGRRFNQQRGGEQRSRGRGPLHRNRCPQSRCYSGIQNSNIDLRFELRPEPWSQRQRCNEGRKQRVSWNVV